jgi:hypothetical protein
MPLPCKDAMKTYLPVVLCLATLLLGACATAPQSPVSLTSDALSRGTRVGVAMTKMPKIDTEFPGAGCLLCQAAASVANSSLTSYTHTLNPEELPKLKDMVADLVRKKSRDVEVIVVAEDLDVRQLKKFEGSGTNLAKQNFGPLKDKYKVDKLILIDITDLGFVRSYAAYIPTGEPRAELHGTLSMVNLSSNAYELYVPLRLEKAADGAWDEAPKFPGLTNAYYQVLELGKDAVTSPFLN